MKRKYLAVGIILLFIGTCIVPATAQDIEKPLPTSRGNWLYVGGSGPGNYTSIQEAITSASNGDVVFVYNDLSPYREILTINHSINLVGENRNSTIINGSGRNENVILITAENVTMQGFTIWGMYPSIGVMVNGDNATIADVWVPHLQNGMIIMASGSNSLVENCLIKDCIIEDANIGLYTEHTWNVTISNTVFSDSDLALGLIFSFDCTISSNLVTDSHVGLNSNGGANNLFVGNTVMGCDDGLYLESSNDRIINNNFLNVTRPAYFYRHPWAFFMMLYEAKLYPEEEYNHVFVEEYRVFGVSVWDGNYWNEPKTAPYVIPGWRGDVFIMLSYSRHFPPNRLAFDRHPAQEPYDLPVVSS
jgi:hypothetical protein